MLDLDVKVNMDRNAFAKVDRAMIDSMRELAKQLDEEIKRAQVIPKQSGRLEDSQYVISNGLEIAISYNTPYAARLYYHPEYDFRADKNVNAQGKWLEAVLKKDDITEKFAKLLRERI